MLAHRLSGLVIESDEPLIGLDAERRLRRPLPDTRLIVTHRPSGEGAGPGWELVLEVHPPGAPELHFMSIARRDSEYRVRIDGYADFVIDSEARHVVCEAVPSASRADVDQLLLDVLVPMIIHRRGGLCLHASAIAHRRRALAFVAPSGSGKSTLAAALARREGVTMMSDDGLALDVAALDRGVALVYPGRASARLRQEAAQHLASSFDGKARRDQEQRSGKTRLMTVPPLGTHPLDAIYVLEHADEPPHRVPMTAAEAMAELVHHVHRLDPDDRRLLAQEMDHLARLVCSVNVWRLRYRRCFEELPLVESLALEWSGKDSDRPA